MNKFILILSASLIYISANSQAKNCIKNAWAFYAEHVPGNIPVDPNGETLYHGPDTVYAIYVETCKEDEIKWANAWLNGKKYVIETLPVIKFPVEAGVKKSNEQKIFIKPGSENSLWQLQFSSPSRQKSPYKIKKNEIILEGKCKGKKIIYRITNQTELILPPSV